MVPFRLLEISIGRGKGEARDRRMARNHALMEPGLLEKTRGMRQAQTPPVRPWLFIHMAVGWNRSQRKGVATCRDPDFI